MAVDYLLSADGTAPIEVQLSFLKSRMKMVRSLSLSLPAAPPRSKMPPCPPLPQAPQEIAEALRLTGLGSSDAPAGLQENTITVII